MELRSEYIEVHIFRKHEEKMEFLLLRRAAGELYEGVWQMVSGKIERGEKAYEAALRELKEETGLTPRDLWLVPRINSFYSPEEDTINFLPVFVAQVEMDAAVILSDEHSAFEWIAGENAKKLLAWEGQKLAVDLIYEYFSANFSNLIMTKIPFTE